MLKWDGTNITSLVKREEMFIEEAVLDKYIYWRLSFFDNGIWKSDLCIVRSCTHNSMCCFIDELKPLFGLNKIGSHWLKFKNKTLVLYKPHIENDMIVNDVTLNLVDYRSKLKREVQKIFTFRELLAISRSFESSIVLRIYKNRIKPISFYEPNMAPGGNSKIIPETVLEKWFKDTSIDEVIKNMTKIKDASEITSFLLQLKTKMDEICTRVDSNLITSTDEIVSRIRSRLQFIF